MISCGLSTAYGKVHPCRKLAQCVGLEPTRRINARRLSKPFQYHYGNTAEFSYIAKNIVKEAVGTFLAGVMPTGGSDPPFCYLAYSDCFKWKVPESNRPHGLLVHLTVIASLRYTFPYAFPCSASEAKHGDFYLRRASASHLLVGSYPTTSERQESNPRHSLLLLLFQLRYVPKPPYDG